MYLPTFSKSVLKQEKRQNPLKSHYFKRICCFTVEYGNCLETGEMTKSFEKLLSKGIFVVFSVSRQNSSIIPPILAQFNQAKCRRREARHKKCTREKFIIPTILLGRAGIFNAHICRTKGESKSAEKKSNLRRRTFGRIESIRKWKRWTKVFSPVPRNPRCTSFIRVCKDLALGCSSPPSLFSLVSLNSTKSEMRPVLWLQLHLVNEIKSPDNRCKMQRNVPGLTFSICQMKSSDQIFIIKLNHLILFQCNTFLLFKEGDNLIWAQAPSCTLE